MPNSKELKKFELDIVPIAVFISLIVISVLFFFFLGIVNSSNSLSQSKNYFTYALNNLKIKNLKEEQEILKQKNQFLEDELQKAENINKKYKVYEHGIVEKNKELADLIEDAIGYGIFENLREGESNTYSSGIGGKEVLEKQDESFKGSFNVDTYQSRDVALITDMGKINEVIRSLPIGVPLNGKYSSGFGRRISPFTGRLVKHLGIDFSKPYGSLVRSTGDGKVIKAKYAKDYGYMIDIKHNDHIVTRYAHLSKILVKEGESISRGKVIGQVGSSGRSTGSHLHYEVRVNNEAVNPISFIKLAGTITKKFQSFDVARN